MINNGANSQVTGTQPIKLQEVFRYKIWNNFDYNHQNVYFTGKNLVWITAPRLNYKTG